MSTTTAVATSDTNEPTLDVRFTIPTELRAEVLWTMGMSMAGFAHRCMSGLPQTEEQAEAHDLFTAYADAFEHLCASDVACMPVRAARYLADTLENMPGDLIGQQNYAEAAKWLVLLAELCAPGEGETA